MQRIKRKIEYCTDVRRVSTRVATFNATKMKNVFCKLGKATEREGNEHSKRKNSMNEQAHS